MSSSASGSCSRSGGSTPSAMAPTPPTLECACRHATVSFVCNKGDHVGKSFVKCRYQICYTWIWEEQLSKYVDAMVEYKTAAEIRGLRASLEAANTKVRLQDVQISAKEDQIRSKDALLVKDEQISVKDEQGRAKDELLRVKDEHIALVSADIASMRAKMEEITSSLTKFKMLFWGLLFLCCVWVVSNNTI